MYMFCGSNPLCDSTWCSLWYMHLCWCCEDRHKLSKFVWVWCWANLWFIHSWSCNCLRLSSGSSIGSTTGSTTDSPPSGVKPISASSKGAMDSEDHASALDLSESVTVQYSLLSYCLTLYTRIYMAIAVLEMTASHWPFSKQVANLTDHSATCSATVA